MTRKEEVYESSKEYGKGILLKEDRMMCEAAYQQGAHWADKTMIYKACEYLEDVGDGICIPDMKKFIVAFRKAMEE